MAGDMCKDWKVYDSNELEKSQRDDSNSAFDIYPSIGDVIPNNTLRVLCSHTIPF